MSRVQSASGGLPKRSDRRTNSSSTVPRPTSSSSSGEPTPLPLSPRSQATTAIPANRTSRPSSSAAATASTSISQPVTPAVASSNGARPPSGPTLRLNPSRPTSVQSPRSSSSQNATPLVSPRGGGGAGGGGSTSGTSSKSPSIAPSPTHGPRPASSGKSAAVEADILPRTKHAERILAHSLSAQAKRVADAQAAAALAKTKTATSSAIAHAGNAALRLQSYQARKAAANPSDQAKLQQAVLSWNSTVADSRDRELISVPINRLMNFTSFLGLFGEIGQNPQGVLALFGAALWLYAQAVPPQHAEHATSVVQQNVEIKHVELAPDAQPDGNSAGGLLRLGNAVIGSSSTAPAEDPALRRRNQMVNKRAGVMLPNARGAIIGSHDAPLHVRGASSSVLVPGIGLGLSTGTSGFRFGVNAQGVRAGFGAMGFQFSPSAGGMYQQPQDLAAVADQILLFLLDDLLTEVRDNSPKRYFRASDRALLDHYLRGHPEVIVRYSGADRKTLRAQAARAKAEQRQAREKKKARRAKKAEKKAKQLQEEEEDDDATYQVSLKNSSDEDTSEEDKKDRSGSSSSSSSSDEDEKEGDGDGWEDSSNSDTLQFTIESNAFSLDTTGLHVNPNQNGGESRVTTRFLSSDHFARNLTPIRLRKDRAGIWRVYNFYALFFNSGLPGPSAIEIPSSMPVVAVPPTPSILLRSNPTPEPPPDPSEEVKAEEPPTLIKRPSIFAMMASGTASPAMRPSSRAMMAQSILTPTV